MLCLKAFQVKHLPKQLTVLYAAVKQSEQAEIRSSVPTVRRRNSGREMQNLCLQKGHGWMFMMPRSRQNKGLKMVERIRQYTFMLLRFKTSTQKKHYTTKILNPNNRTRCYEALCYCLVLFVFVANTVAHCTYTDRTQKPLCLLGTCNVCTDVRKIITRKR